MKITTETRQLSFADIQENYVNRKEIKELINERQFELQQEYKDFKDDIRLNTLQEIYYLGKEGK